CGGGGAHWLGACIDTQYAELSQRHPGLTLRAATARAAWFLPSPCRRLCAWSDCPAASRHPQLIVTMKSQERRAGGAGWKGFRERESGQLKFCARNNWPICAVRSISPISYIESCLCNKAAIGHSR